MVTAHVVDFPQKSIIWDSFSNDVGTGSKITSRLLQDPFQENTLPDCRAQPARAWTPWPDQIRPEPFSALESLPHCPFSFGKTTFANFSFKDLFLRELKEVGATVFLGVDDMFLVESRTLDDFGT